MNTSLKKGKVAEHFLISKLLRRGLEVFTPICDDHGIDFIVSKNRFFEFQVKARRIWKSNDKFVLRDFNPRDSFFIICFDLNSYNYYILPSKLIKQKCYSFGYKKKYKVIPWWFLLKYEKYKNYKGLDLVFNPE